VQEAGGWFDAANVDAVEAGEFGGGFLGPAVGGAATHTDVGR